MLPTRIALLHAPYAATYGPLKSASGRYFPLGLGYLGAVLRKEGHEILFLDPEAQGMPEEAVAKALKEFSPRLAGVSCATPSFPGARRLGALVRKAVPGCATIVGGIHVSAMPGRALEEAPEFDLAVSGEGEETMRELVALSERHPEWNNNALTGEVARERVEGLAGIRGLAFRAGEEVRVNPPRPWIEDLDSIPFPARDMADFSLYRPHSHNRRGRRATTMITSRGCPYGCVFCASHVALGRKFRAHSPRYVADEMEHLVRDFGVDEVILNDDTFTLDPGRVRGICGEILRRNIRLSWFCFARANTVTPELLALMKRAGCFSIGFGVESGDPGILASINKKVTVEEIRQGVGWANEAGLKTQCFFVFGNPGETAETVEKTIRFAIELRPVLSFFNMMVPYPGTEMFDAHFGGTEGRRDIKWEDWVAVGPRSAIQVPGIPSLERAVAEANRRFYFRPSQIWRYLRHTGSLLEILEAVRGVLALAAQVILWKMSRPGAPGGKA